VKPQFMKNQALFPAIGVLRRELSPCFFCVGNGYTSVVFPKEALNLLISWSMRPALMVSGQNLKPSNVGVDYRFAN